MASILLFISALYDTPKRDFKIKKLMSLFLGICIFSVVVNGFEIRNISALINIFIGCVDVIILAVYSENLKKCLNWLIVGLGINTLFMITQMFGFTQFAAEKIGQYKEFGGIIGNAPRFAAFIALCLPFVSVWYIIPALILGILLKEASIFVSILVILVYQLVKQMKYKTLAFVSIGVLGLIGFFHSYILQAFSIRLTVWKTLLENLFQRPLIGFGLGFFDIADYGFSIMQWLYGVGILGIGFIVICLKRMEWYMVPLLFLCIVEYPFEIPRLYPLIIFVIAYYAINQREERLC